MPYTFTPIAFSGGASLIAGPFAITAFGAAPNTVSAPGLGTPAVRGDAIDILGSTSNDGDYCVLDVVDANTLEVFPAPTVEAAAGNVELRAQNHTLLIEDEPVVSATTIATAMALLDSRIFERKFQIGSPTPGREFSLYGFLIREFQFNNTGPTTTDFLNEFEVWFLDWDGTVRTGPGFATHWVFTANITATAGALTNISIGSLADPADPRSVQRGSALINCSLSAPASSEVSISVFGSFIHLGSEALFNSLNDGPGVGQVAGSVFHSGLIAPSTGGSLDTLQTIIHSSPRFGVAPLGPITNAANFLQADSAQPGVIFSTAEVVLREVELSDSSATPSQLAFVSAVRFIDPREDYTAAELFQLNGAAAAKTYTFNPRIVDVNFQVGASPIAGLEVSIDRLSDGHYLRVIIAEAGTYTVTINGEDHTVVFAGGSITVLRNQLIGAINAGTQPVTAADALNSGQITAGVSGIIISADVEDVLMQIAITVEPTLGNLVLDPPPTVGASLLLTGDYREGPVAGSPFITDANGRINIDGVELNRFTGYENGIGASFINHQYRVNVEGSGYRRVIDGLAPSAPFQADFPVEDKSMGEFRP